MKKKFFNIIFYGLIILIAAKQIILYQTQSQIKGTEVTKREFNIIHNESEAKRISLPFLDKNSIFIFWASWCTPCKLEMNRLKVAKLDPKLVIAINPFEDMATIKKFIAKNDYPFQFIEDHNLGQELKIQATPTTVFLEKNKIKKVNTGVSLLGIWHAESFLGTTGEH